MTSHAVANILLSKPDAPLVVSALRGEDDYVLREVTSIAFTNCGHFIDESGFGGEDDTCGRDCIEIE